MGCYVGSFSIFNTFINARPELAKKTHVRIMLLIDWELSFSLLV